MNNNYQIPGLPYGSFENTPVYTDEFPFYGNLANNAPDSTPRFPLSSPAAYKNKQGIWNRAWDKTKNAYSGISNWYNSSSVTPKDIGQWGSLISAASGVYDAIENNKARQKALKLAETQYADQKKRDDEREKEYKNLQNSIASVWNRP